MDIKTFTKQNLAFFSYQSVLYENIQAHFDKIPLTKVLLVKLFLPICLIQI
jgi:hypothetical protein